MNIYSIRDDKAEAFMQPFYSVTHLTAMRSVEQAANDPESQIGRYPQDFQLYHLGEFDETTGKCKLNDAPEHLISIFELKKENTPLKEVG